MFNNLLRQVIAGSQLHFFYASSHYMPTQTCQEMQETCCPCCMLRAIMAAFSEDRF